MRQRNKAEYQYDPKLFRSDRNSTEVSPSFFRAPTKSSGVSIWSFSGRAAITMFVFIAALFIGFLLACYAAVAEWEMFHHGVRLMIRMIALAKS